MTRVYIYRIVQRSVHLKKVTFMRNIPLVILSTITLSACGGASTSTDTVNLNRPTSALGITGLSRSEVLTISEFVSDFNDDLSLTPLSGIPVTGTADYYGPISFTVGELSESDPLETQGALGVLALNIDFENSIVTGDAGSFHDIISGDATPGELSFENGIIGGSLSTVQGDLTGDIAFAEGVETLDLEGDGIFAGETAEENTGGIFGTATGADGDEQDVRGVWQIIPD